LLTLLSLINLPYNVVYVLPNITVLLFIAGQLRKTTFEYLANVLKNEIVLLAAITIKFWISLQEGLDE